MIARANPYCVSRVLKVRFQPLTTTWPEIMLRLEQLEFRAAIVGPEGSGKTTLLEDIAGQLSERFSIRWFSLTQDSPIPSFREIEPHHLVMIDGADLLSFWQFRKLVRKRTRGLLITSHWDPALPVLLKTSTTVNLLNDINQKLIGEKANQLQDLSAQLFVKHQGNLRDALRELYDIWSNEPPH